MSSSSTERRDAPVHDTYLADPFVWRHGQEWFAVGTGAPAAAGDTRREPLVFPLLRSTDFVHWSAHGRALVRPDAALGDAYWAPEVAHHDGVFHLYYSVGFGERRHHLRVATSREPAGPYRDTGVALTDPDSCPFAIDPHPFQDVDGAWYLFSARDFLDADGSVRAGTALVVQRLETMTRLAPGEPTVVLRAHHEWQRFRADRLMYGARFDWHTLEGPCVVRRRGRYWCLYSGGCWETERYGVDYATAASVAGPYDDRGGTVGPRVLSTCVGLRGPGHATVVAGPDGSDHLAFHAWDAAGRVRRMFLRPLVWTSDGPRLADR